jgi:hypothetical protein
MCHVKEWGKKGHHNKAETKPLKLKLKPFIILNFEEKLTVVRNGRLGPSPW